MKLIIRSLIVAAFVLIAVAPSYAQKTGYVNSDAIIAAMPESQQAQKTLEDYKKKLDGEIQEKIKVYQTNFQAAQQRVASEMLTPIQKGELEAALKKEEDEIVAFEQSQADLYQKRTVELYEPIFAKANTAIQSVAQENGYQMILDTKTQLIIYSDGTGDITKQVAAKLGLPLNNN